MDTYSQRYKTKQTRQNDGPVLSIYLIKNKTILINIA